MALRRSRTDQTAGPSQSSLYQNGELRIDYAAGCAYMGGKEIHLTSIEYKLLCVLAKNTGKVLTHNYILKEVWGTALAADIPSLRVFMATLRKKIERDPSAWRWLQDDPSIDSAFQSRPLLRAAFCFGGPLYAFNPCPEMLRAPSRFIW